MVKNRIEKIRLNIQIIWTILSNGYIIGFVQGKILDELYSNAYIYSLPSDLEGMPLSLLEAMSFGNCCLTSNIDECAAVIGEFGLTFEKGNIKDLTAKLQDLCDNPKKVESFKTASADYIINKYNWDDVTYKTLALYGANNQPAKENKNENIAYK